MDGSNEANDSAALQLRWGRLQRELDIGHIARWLCGLGALPPHKRPPDSEGAPYPKALDQYLRDRNPWGIIDKDPIFFDPNGSEKVFAHQIMGHLDAALAAYRHRGDDFTTFMTGIAIAQDAAKAAIDAGFDAPPLPAIFDHLTAIIAYGAALLSSEIMKRLLAGQISGEDATKAWVILNDPKWNEQRRENAERGAKLLRRSPAT
jgi:hypothetical protein